MDLRLQTRKIPRTSSASLSTTSSIRIIRLELRMQFGYYYFSSHLCLWSRHHTTSTMLLTSKVLCHVFICAIAVAYSMGHIIKLVCICAYVYLCIRLSALLWSHFLIDFHQIGTDVKTLKSKNEFVGGQHRTTLCWEEHVTLAQLCNKVPISYNETPQIDPQICLFPFVDHYSHLICPSLDQPDIPPQTVSRSNQPFCHNALSGQKDTQTDTWDKQQVYSESAYILLY